MLNQTRINTRCWQMQNACLISSPKRLDHGPFCCRLDSQNCTYCYAAPYPADSPLALLYHSASGSAQCPARSHLLPRLEEEDANYQQRISQRISLEIHHFNAVALEPERGALRAVWPSELLAARGPCLGTHIGEFDICGDYDQIV